MTSPSAECVESGWLRRVVRVVLADGTEREVTYNGRGFGFETVVVDGERQARSSEWFVPRFEFWADGIDWRVDVRVWPWLGLKDLWIYANGALVYSERQPPPPTRF